MPTFSGLADVQHQHSFPDISNLNNSCSNTNQSSGYHTLNETTEQQTTELFINIDEPLATSSPIKQRKIDIYHEHVCFFLNWILSVIILCVLYGVFSSSLTRPIS